MQNNTRLILREYGKIKSGTVENCPVCQDEPSRRAKDELVLCSRHYEELRVDLEEARKSRHANAGDKRKVANFGHNEIQLQNYVGTLATKGSGIVVEILPKIDLGAGSEESIDARTRGIFLHMLKPSLKKNKYILYENTPTENYRDMPLLELLIRLFIDEVETLLRKGLAHAYVTREDNLYCLRGKLNFAGQIRHNLVRKERFYTQYDEWTPDRPANRIIKCALDAVYRATRDAANYRSIIQLLPHFDEVSPVSDWPAEDRKIQLQHNVRSDYESPLAWARIILESLNPASWHGSTRAYSLLFPMEQVFESFVAAELKNSIKRYGYNLTTQDSRHHLMSGDGIPFAMTPDMVARHPRNDNAPCLILDTKWKRINRDNNKDKYGISQADLYQLYSYGMRYQREENSETTLFLLYPCNDQFKETITLTEGRNNHTRQNRMQLYIVPIHLSKVDGKHNQESLKSLFKIFTERGIGDIPSAA